MISKVPVWVFAIFLGLLFLGHRQSRTRLVAPGALAGLAAGMLGLSLYGVVAAFGARADDLLAWALGLALCVTLGGAVLGPRGLSREAGAVRVPGSWLPLAMMMGIFAAKFALGFATAVGSPLVAQRGFAVVASFVFGLLSGGFVARALAVYRFARRTGPRPAGGLDLPGHA